MKIHIKNMVCQRYVMVVNVIVQKADINDAKVQLGKIEANRLIPENCNKSY